jgi:hypothetical protein
MDEGRTPSSNSQCRLGALPMVGVRTLRCTSIVDIAVADGLHFGDH